MAGQRGGPRGRLGRRLLGEGGDGQGDGAVEHRRATNAEIHARGLIRRPSSHRPIAAPLGAGLTLPGVPTFNVLLALGEGVEAALAGRHALDPARPHQRLHLLGHGAAPGRGKE